MTTTKRYFRKPLALLMCAALAAGVMMVVLASPAWAASYTVDRSDDPDLTTTPTADDCTEAANDCSLRGAINAANASTGVPDTIGFDPALSGQPITLNSSLGQLPTITAAGGALTMDGESANITISGGGSVRVFVVNGGNLTLNNLTVADGSSSLGGGIINQGTLTVTNSTFSGNSTDGSGGGIFNGTNNTLTVTNSTFSGNSANTGGGIYNNTAGMITVTNSTFSGNSGVNGPGAIRNFEGTVTLSNTIVANSTAILGNCAGPITDAGGNLSSDASCGFTASTSKSNTPAGLDPAGLQPNGGPTNTIALQGDSAAIDAAVNCPPPTTDQRGVSRPQGSACDIGAYEVEVAVDNTAPFVTETSPLQLKKTDNVTAEFSEPVKNVTTETFILERKVAVKKNTPPKFEPVLASVSPASGEVGVGGLATLNPAQDLPKGEYRATITTEVTDLADNKLDQDQDPNNGNQPKVWTFTVAK